MKIKTATICNRQEQTAEVFYRKVGGTSGPNKLSFTQKNTSHHLLYITQSHIWRECEKHKANLTTADRV